MSVRTEKSSGYITFHCDNCSEYFTKDSEDFKETLKAMKKEKWTYQQEQDDGWSHYCPVCSEKDYS
jgi:hypothetical protein